MPDDKKKDDKKTLPDPTEETLNSRFYLSGDFSSPIELLGAHSLTIDQKREVLETWLGELERQGDNPELRELRRELEVLLADLPR